MENVVYLSSKGNPITDSRLVATKFDIRHDNVLAKIRKLLEEYEQLVAEASPDALLLDPKLLFASLKRRDMQGKEQEYFVMSEDGFLMLAMRLSGPRVFKFQTEFVAAFRTLREDNIRLRERLAASAVSQVTEDTVLRLLPYTDQKMQRQRSRQAYAYHFDLTQNSHGPVAYYRASFKLVTGSTPTNYRDKKVKEQHKVKSLSGREALRKVEPAKACVLAMVDDQVMNHGYSLESQQQAGLPQALVPAFEALLKLGHDPNALEIGRGPLHLS